MHTLRCLRFGSGKRSKRWRWRWRWLRVAGNVKESCCRIWKRGSDHTNKYTLKYLCVYKRLVRPIKTRKYNLLFFLFSLFIFLFCFIILVIVIINIGICHSLSLDNVKSYHGPFATLVWSNFTCPHHSSYPCFPCHLGYGLVQQRKSEDRK